MAPGYNRLAQCVGEAAARELCERLGGTSVYVGVSPRSDSRLTLAIGHEAAHRLASTYGGESILIPSREALRTHDRRAAVLQALATGQTPADIAVTHGLTERHVRRIRCFLQE
jgi:hypothetical protein